ncbi:MAG: hypothetical protein AAGI23_12350 [Bacteroidota bacterium]
MRYKHSFPITGITWHQYTELVENNYSILRGMLNNLLDLSNYGNSVQGLAFLYIIQQPERDFHKEKIRFNREQKELYGQFLLDVSLILDTSEDERLSIMAEMYWRCLSRFERLEIEDFDLSTFQHDVKEMFETAGLIAIPEASSGV